MRSSLKLYQSLKHFDFFSYIEFEDENHLLTSCQTRYVTLCLKVAVIFPSTFGGAQLTAIVTVAICWGVWGVEGCAKGRIANTVTLSYNTWQQAQSNISNWLDKEQTWADGWGLVDLIVFSGSFGPSVSTQRHREDVQCFADTCNAHITPYCVVHANASMDEYLLQYLLQCARHLYSNWHTILSVQSAFTAYIAVHLSPAPLCTLLCFAAYLVVTVQSC